jgi:hypothetical protein
MSSGQDSPYVVYNASNGVILHSKHMNESIVTPVRGTEVYLEDRFELNDDRYTIRIKDTKNGEVYSFTGKAQISPKQIVDASRVTVFRKFLSFIALQAEEFGLNTSHVYTSQCVTYKGKDGSFANSISHEISMQIKSAIDEGRYCKEVACCKKMNDDGTYSYAITNLSSEDYGFVIYTVDSENRCYDHGSVVLNISGSYSSDNIAYVPLRKNSTLELPYISIAEDDLEKTCYVIVFRPLDFYHPVSEGYYETNIDWTQFEKELVNQGSKECVIRID